MKKNCILFVCNKEYFSKFIYSCELLIANGKPTREKIDICLIIGNDLQPHLQDICNFPLIKNNEIIVKHFPDIEFTNEYMELCYRTKLFQFHKFHIFSMYFKEKWKYILYIDCGMTIFKEIQPLFDLPMIKESIVAHSDAYPTYEWKLYTQFIEPDLNTSNLKKYKEKYEKVERDFNLNVDYFQTTMLLYDTSIIHSNTIENLSHLMETYPTSKMNDQGIIALYFIHIEPKWNVLPIKINETNTNSVDDTNNYYTYDFMKRNPNYSYIMVKRL